MTEVLQESIDQIIEQSLTEARVFRNKIESIAQSIEAQAECLEKYALDNGFTEKPVPSVFHIQASHFRDLSKELMQSIGSVA